MSKLQKSAWYNLSLVTTGSLFGMLCFTLAANRIEKGINYINIILCLLVVSIIIPIVLIIHKKKGFETGFDEREKIINERATVLSNTGLVIFLSFACFIPFVALGGGNTIRIIYLPVIFVCAAFITQLIKSLAIIIQLKWEQTDEQ